jgi:hypothetical protein
VSFEDLGFSVGGGAPGHDAASSPGGDVSLASEDLVLLPYVAARAALAGRALRFRVLRPPYPVVGLGALRALRVVALSGEHDGAWELVAGYDGYDKL